MSIAGVLGSVVGAGASIFGANKAAKAQKQAAALQARQFEETKELLSPYTGAGEKALGVYSDSVGLNGADAQKAYFDSFQTDPGWQASQDYATRGITNLNAIRGKGATSGNLIAGLGDYLQKNMLDAYRTRQSQIGGLVDTGKGAASALAGYGQQSAQAQAGNLANAGYYQGAGIANAGNALTQGIQNAQMMNLYKTALGGSGGLNSAGNFFFG